MTSKDDAKTEMLDAFASASRRLHDETNILIRRQWRSLMIAGLMVVLSIVITIWAAFYFMREQMMHRMLETARQQLLRKIHRQEAGAGVDPLVARHAAAPQTQCTLEP